MGNKKKSQLPDELADALFSESNDETPIPGKAGPGGLQGGTVATDQVLLETVKAGGTRQSQPKGPQAEAHPDDFFLDVTPEPKEISVAQPVEPTKEMERGAKTKLQAAASETRFQVSIPTPLKAPKPVAEVASVERIQHLQIAQERILELERELDRLRVENDELQANVEILNLRLDESLHKVDSLGKQNKDLEDVHADEKRISAESRLSKDRELEQLRLKNAELEKRLVGDLKKVRVRERELENRLEIIKSENAAVIRSKNEMILNVRRQTDLVAQELEAVKQKYKTGQDQLGEIQDRNRRAVKALRLAMALLNGEEMEAAPASKKAE